MIPEIGQFALILALSLAICQAVLPLVGAHRGDAAMMNVGRTAALGHFVFVAVSFACLIWAFLNDDFSVLYVANHSQLALPTLYKVSAVWGAHEGSLLLWILLLAGWTVARTIMIGPPMMMVGIPAKQAFLGAAIASSLISVFTLLRIFDAKHTGLAGLKGAPSNRRRPAVRRPTRRR